MSCGEMDQQPEEPGAIDYRELVARAQHLSREKFIAERTAPVLLLFSGGAAPSDPSTAKTTAGFATVIPGVTSQAHAPKPLKIYEVAKRKGANAFDHMITLGRAPNNDIVLLDASVSKFHLSFTRREEAWLVTDSSTHGTWLGGAKLERGVATPIESAAALSLARSVALRFLSPED